jgi:hypothetical protein
LHAADRSGGASLMRMRGSGCGKDDRKPPESGVPNTGKRCVIIVTVEEFFELATGLHEFTAPM